MNDFNLLVLNIAGIVLIGALIVVGIMIYYASRDQQFPPIQSDCPTFYQLDETGKNCVFNSDNNPYYNDDISYPSRTQQINESSCYSVSLTEFEQQGTTDKDIICAKNKWANGCNVYWDGITNNPDACVKNFSVFNNN
jgi:hypothetical protein